MAENNVGGHGRPAEGEKRIRDGGEGPLREPGGERGRLMMAKMFAGAGNFFGLDEPTNDLDVETLRALESALLDFPGCAVVISHDRWFLDRTATHILAFEGNSEVVWFTGNYDDYERDRKRRLGADADQPQEIKYKPLIRD